LLAKSPYFYFIFFLLLTKQSCNELHVYILHHLSVRYPNIFLSNATTCTSRTSWSPLPVVAQVQ
jgi:hypothetical protein